MVTKKTETKTRGRTLDDCYKYIHIGEHNSQLPASTEHLYPNVVQVLTSILKCEKFLVEATFKCVLARAFTAEEEGLSWEVLELEFGY